MKTKNLLKSMMLFTALAASLLPVNQLSAQQVDGPVQVVLNYGESTETRYDSRPTSIDRETFPRLHFQSAQPVSFTLQFPLSKVGEEVIIESLDGGELILTFSPNGGAVVTSAGLVPITFRPNRNLGVYRLMVHSSTGIQAIELAFKAP